MSRSKKTRNVGDTAPKHAPRVKKSERKITAKKHDSGNKSGSRNSVKDKMGAVTAGQTQDPRHGSKRPVALNIDGKLPVVAPKKTKSPKLSDEQKLIQLEEDPRLNQLLDQLEEGRQLTVEDQTWLDKQLAQIESLMQKLGLTEEEDFTPVASDSDDDLLDKFDSGLDSLKDYQK